MARNALRVILGLLSLLILLVMLAVIEHYRGVGRLGQWRRAALARGEKLTIAELAPPLPPGQATIPPDQVAAALLAFAGNGKTSEAAQALETRLKMNGATPGRVPAAWQSDWEWKDLAESTNTWAESAASVEELRPRFQAVRSNLAERGWMIGHEYAKGLHGKTVPIFDLLGMAKVLAAAAAVDLHQHRVDDAREHLMTLLRLANVLEADQYVIGQVGRVGMVHRAIPATWQALQAPGWTEPQLAQLQSTWQSQRYLSNVIRALQMERALWDEDGFGRSRVSLTDSINVINEVGGRRGLPTDWVMVWRYAWLDQDQCFHDRAWQDPIDFARTVLSATSCQAAWRQRGPAPGGTSAPDLHPPNFMSAVIPSSRYDRMRYSHSCLFLPRTLDLIDSAIILENFREMLLAAVALKRYELRNGRPAPSLAALVPEYLDTVPVDFMDGQPLRYRLQEDGTWRLYSIGWDGKDDGGDPTPASPGQKYETFSDGRDWVWPVPATPPDRGKAR